MKARMSNTSYLNRVLSYIATYCSSGFKCNDIRGTYEPHFAQAYSTYPYSSMYTLLLHSLFSYRASEEDLKIAEKCKYVGYEFFNPETALNPSQNKYPNSVAHGMLIAVLFSSLTSLCCLNSDSYMSELVRWCKQHSEMLKKYSRGASQAERVTANNAVRIGQKSIGYRTIIFSHWAEILTKNNKDDIAYIFDFLEAFIYHCVCFDYRVCFSVIYLLLDALMNFDFSAATPGSIITILSLTSSPLYDVMSVMNKSFTKHSAQYNKQDGKTLEKFVGLYLEDYEELKRREQARLIYFDGGEISVAEVNKRCAKLTIAYRRFCGYLSGARSSTEEIQKGIVTESLATTNELATLRSRLEEYEKHMKLLVKNWDKERVQFEDEKSRLSRANEQLQTKCNDLKKELNDCRQRVTSTQGNVTQQNLLLSQLRSENDTLKKKLEAYTGGTVTVEKLVSLREELAKRDRIIASLKSEMTDVRKTSRKTTTESDSELARVKLQLEEAQKLILALETPDPEDSQERIATDPLTEEEIAMLAVIKADLTMPDIPALRNKLKKLLPLSSFTFIPNDRNVVYNIPNNRDVWVFNTKMSGHLYWYKWYNETAAVRERAVPCPSVNVNVICRIVLDVYKRTCVTV